MIFCFNINGKYNNCIGGTSYYFKPKVDVLFIISCLNAYCRPDLRPLEAVDGDLGDGGRKQPAAGARRGGAPNFLRRKGACSLYIHSIYSITEVLQLGKKIQVLCSAYIDRRFFVVDRRFLMYTLCIVLYILLYIHTVHGKVFVDGTLKSVHRPGYYILKSVCRRGIKKQKSACRWKIEKRLPM